MRSHKVFTDPSRELTTQQSNPEVKREANPDAITEQSNPRRCASGYRAMPCHTILPLLLISTYVPSVPSVPSLPQHPLPPLLCIMADLDADQQYDELFKGACRCCVLARARSVCC